jgi:hypothetical protein
MYLIIRLIHLILNLGLFTFPAFPEFDINLFLSFCERIHERDQLEIATNYSKVHFRHEKAGISATGTTIGRIWQTECLILPPSD